ncbi:MAG: peptide chain release factor 1 [bacterium]|nr:peptide chain release factor 1 [bacterium]
MFDRIEEVEARYNELEAQLATPEIASNPNLLREVSQELAALRDTVETYRRLKELRTALADNEDLLGDSDAEIAELAKAELGEIRPQIEIVEAELKRHLIPKDPRDSRNVVIEIRGGTGGDEAALFSHDLFRMYSRYADERKWKVEVLSASETDGGGMKEVIATITGSGAYGRLKHESGVHRVQRVPATESQGRIHTSTATVAVLPEAEEADVTVEDKDLRIDVYRASGPGGQSVNTTDSAVRITHLPTGLVVTCQDEKSQHKNKARAMKILRSRLYDAEQDRLAAERATERKGQIGTGGRSERIRTYNFPQNRVTDHRVGVTLHKLERVMEGDLGELIEQVVVDLEARELEG